MNDVSRNRKWNSLLRIAGFAGAIGGMYISAQFSVKGFEFSVQDTAWVGWAIALIIIILESVWQKFGRNRTLFAIALGCYAYGVTTNVVGIVQAKGGYSQVNALDYVVAVFFGLLFEVFPEPLLAWSISGDTTSDPLGAFLDGLEGKVQSKPVQQAYYQKSQYKPQHKPNFSPRPKPNPVWNPKQVHTINNIPFPHMNENDELE
jgi:hypothetical protein